ncbi:MAG: hypothetical protein R3335_08135 [Anaerolineales bacterium]|nr:hypothetical protein [Anaerolineales bacterium]
MDKSELVAVYEQDQRRDVAYPGMRREATPEIVRHIDLSDLGEGMISFSRLDGSNADQVIRRQVDYYESIGQNFEWKVYDYDRPTDLKERLGSLGFTVEDADALLILDLQTAPEVLAQPVRHNIQKITDPEKLADVQTVEAEVWEEDAAWVLQFLSEPLRKNPDEISVFVAYIDEGPASAAWAYFQEGSQFASLWGGATINRYRRQGLFTALVAARAQEAIARGVRYLSVEAMPMSRPILEKLGFQLIAYTYPCKWEIRSQN